MRARIVKIGYYYVDPYQIARAQEEHVRKTILLTLNLLKWRQDSGSALNAKNGIIVPTGVYTATILQQDLVDH